MESIAHPLKTCTRCHQAQPLTSFYENNRYRDGYTTWCKSCFVAYRKTPKQRQKSKEYYQKWYADPDRRAAHRAQSNAYARNRWHTDPEYRKRKNAQNMISKRRPHRREKLRFISRMRSQQRRHSERVYGLTVEVWKQICAAYGNRCLCCGKHGVKLHIDHVLPRVKGGTIEPANIQPLCHACNSRKHDKHIDYRPDKGKRIVHMLCQIEMPLE